MIVAANRNDVLLCMNCHYFIIVNRNWKRNVTVNFKRRRRRCDGNVDDCSYEGAFANVRDIHLEIIC